ncbi:hypothetical protein [Streptomyces sp. NPDC046925]|uniref:hypothetical protein n=1 Tax=Streptomyces sp. NPDC046925 TaxID=3155375 RepID=UPI0033E16AD6
MHALPVRRIATSVLCASLLIGTAGPVVAAESDTPHGTTREARAPVPGAEALMTRVTSMSDAGRVITPVTDLLSAVLKADKGQLPAAEAAKLAAPVKEAVDKAAAQAPKSPAVPATPAVPEAAVPETPAVPEAQTLPKTPALPKSLPAPDDLAADPKSDALKALQTSVDALVKAATGGDPTKVAAAVQPVLTSVTGLVTSMMGAVPAAKLPTGAPAL